MGYSIDVFEILFKSIKEFGWVKGVFSIFFFLAHFWIWKLYTNRLKDRQKEIDRIAEENKEYRERFMQLLDKRFGFTNSKPKKGK